MKRVLAAAFILVALGSIFYLPRMVPVSPSISASYLFGYNNRVGVLLLGVFLMVGAFLFHRDFPIPQDESLPTSLIWRWMGIFTTAWAAMYAFARGGFGESVYLINRVQLLAAGRTPYKDFEFAYGPLFLYGPRALMLFHLSSEASYYIFWLGCLLSGVWVLAETLDMLPGTRKPEIFSLLCLFSLVYVLTAGANYTLFRFIPAAYLALFVRAVDTPIERRYRISGIITIIVSMIALLLISPEICAAFSVGILTYYAASERAWSWAIAARYLILVLAQILIFWEANRLGLFSTLKMFAGGAYNFPIVPAGHILLFFFMCGVAALYAGNRMRSGDGIMAVLFVSVGALFAALGRCDPGHVGFAAIGIVLVATLLMSSTRYWNTYRIAFLVFFVALPATSILWTYKGLFYRAIHRQVDNSTTTVALEAPFGYDKFSPSIDTGYFYGMDNTFTTASVAMKIQELESHPDRRLILPSRFENTCKAGATGERKVVMVFFAFPYFGSIRGQENVWAPLCDYIKKHYHDEESMHDGYDIWGY